MNRLGEPIYRFSVVESTMNEIARLAAEGAPEGTAVIAERQNSGRGRAGRTWSTPPGAALLCSVLLRPQLDVHLLSLLPIDAGLAIAEAIESVAPVQCQLKWPNDVLIDGKKIAGVLVQTRSIGERVDHVNLGFGINLTSKNVDLPSGATSLAIATGVQVDRSTFEDAVFNCLTRRYFAYCASGGELDREPWFKRAYLLGAHVRVVDGDQAIEGTHLGIDESGALLLRTDEGVRAIVAGDLTRGPIRSNTPRYI
jgi:BirA family transcriptional regulator, biotin operon repressor / biotin---[acetyl-CoA-carboxylase] ligase